MNANQYLNAALRTENTPEFLSGHRTHDAREQLERIMHGMIGMATETGELQDQVKKHLIYGKPLDVVNVIEEVGDVLWYCAIVLDACSSTFEAAFDRNIAKLKKRFPDKFTEHNALNRDLDAERAALEGTDDGTPG